MLELPTSAAAEKPLAKDDAPHPPPAAAICAPALSEQFRARIRPVLNSIDRLRSHGLQNELRLPAVAVVGDQSVGKSSVLEAISGVDLPRGSGIVTRCPLQLSMRSRPDDKWSGRISYTDAAEKRVELIIPEKSQVGQFVRDAQNAITGSQTAVSKKQIDLTIESSDVSDLTLIDLPGIARYSEKHKNINCTTKDLIRSHIQQEQVIILAVVPCHVDIETVEAIALAKEVDPRGERTIGVMTCPDLTNPGSEDSVIATLCNMGSVKLKKGFVMVKCRSPHELKQNLSLSEVSKTEAEFFANHAHFSRVSRDLVGTKTLAERLTDELFRAVAESMESLEASLKEKLSEYESELKQLGDSLCDSENEKRFYLMRKLQQFLLQVKSVTAYTEIDGVVSGCSSRLYSECLKKCSLFGNTMDYIKPDWVINLLREIPTSVVAEVQELRGRELPTFTFVFPIVHRIVRDEYLPRATEKSSSLLDGVHALVTKALEEVACRLFNAFPALLAVVRQTIAAVTDAKMEECRADLTKLMSHEGRLFTRDSLFSKRHDESVELQRKLALPAPFCGVVISNAPSVFSGLGSVATQARSQLNDSCPSPAPEISNAERVRLGLHAYLSVASQRISDTVPMSVLAHMLDGVSAALEQDMTHMFSDGGGIRILELLQELPGRKRRRRHLEEAVGQMKRSHAEMLKVKRSRQDD